LPRQAIAAIAAVVPPPVLLGSTHRVALLVRSRVIGATYWCALVMTGALAVCAFVLSFDALRTQALTWAAVFVRDGMSDRGVNDARPTGAYGQ
jgi:hypothetical protein